MTQKFIIKTENFIAHMIALKALKAIDDKNKPVVHNLYKKVCMDNGKIVISSIFELNAWKDALQAYKPVSKTEGKVYYVLLATALRGCEKRISNIY